MRRPAVLWSVAGLSVYLLFLASACGGDEENPFAVKSELVSAANLPVALAFAPDGRLFYAERITGDVRVVSADGELQPDPFVHVDVAGVIEWGLTGLALDPDFQSNGYVYIYFSELVDPGPPPIAKPVVKRFTDEDNRGVEPKVIVDDLPETLPNREGFNTNGGMHFGPDGFLYLTLGDYDVKELAQDLSTSVGSMLRIDKETGAAAPDNPFVEEADAEPRIFAYGFREAFDFAFHPETGQIYGSDNTPVSCEELNLVESGSNHGWWQVGEFPFSDCFIGTQVRAVHLFAKPGSRPEDFLSPPIVTGLEFVSSDVYPLLGDSLLVCQSETKFMSRLILSGANLDQVEGDDVVVEDCQLDIAVNPEGIVYYSNQEEIRRLIPVEPEA